MRDWGAPELAPLAAPHLTPQDIQFVGGLWVKLLMPSFEVAGEGTDGDRIGLAAEKGHRGERRFGGHPAKENVVHRQHLGRSRHSMLAVDEQRIVLGIAEELDKGRNRRVGRVEGSGGHGEFDETGAAAAYGL